MSEAAIDSQKQPDTESNNQAPAPERSAIVGRASLWSRVAQNPVVLKELRGRMRGGRAFVILTIYLVLTAAMISLVYFGFYLSTTNAGTMGPDVTRAVGKVIFFSVAGMELMMICFIAPALTAGAIASERERQTYDLLRTTLLSARSLVFGKLASSLGFIWLLLFAGLPLLSLAYLFGGVSIEEVIVAVLMMLVTSIFFSSLGLFFSSFLKRTLAPTVLSYSTTLVMVFGIPTVLLMMVGFIGAFGYSPNPNTWRNLAELLMYIVGWFIVSINPLGTALVTELVLQDNQSIFFTTVNLSSGTSLFILSPWIAYVFLYLLFSAFLILLSILFVKRVEK